MATPTIIIGIGSSGMHTLTQVQKFYYESYGVNKPKHIEYIYLETNEHNRPLGTPLGDDITRVYISLEDMATMIKGIKENCGNPDWLPDTAAVLAAGLGAGGIRSCGRLALWGTNQQGDNFDNVISAITRAYRNVMQIHNNADAANRPTVFVTGSLTGGTGAGIFIDMGYLVRHLIMNITDLYGLFLLPKEPASMTNFEVMYGNAYGAIKDLEYFNAVDHNYKATWPNSFTKDEMDPPYEFVQFISQDYQDGAPAINGLEGLYKMAGLYLFLNVAGIYEKRRERLVDAAGSSQLGKYGTFGLSAIQFPKDLIQDFTASQLSLSLLKKITDPLEYYANGQKRPIARPSIKKMAQIFWDSTLSETFESLNTIESFDILLAIEKEAIKINKSEHTASTQEHIMGLFNSSQNKNFYAMAKSNISSATKKIIDAIYAEVDRNLQKSENLYFAMFTLQDIVESIDNTLDYWRSLSLSMKPDKWDNQLRDLAYGCTVNTYKIVMQQDDILKDRLTNIFELLKIHLSIKVLVDLATHIKEGTIKMLGDQFELPKISALKGFIEKIEGVIGENQEVKTSSVNFTSRLRIITGEVEDITLPILRVYPSNSFKTECDRALQVFNQRSGPMRSISETIGDRNLFAYLKQAQTGNFNDEIYLQFLKEYRSLLERNRCIEDYDVGQYIVNHADESIRTAKRATSPFLKINRILPFSPAIPRFIVASDASVINQVLRTFSDRNYHDFKDSNDGKMVMPELTNIVVFYDEKANFTLSEHLSYINLMKDAYQNVPAQNADRQQTKQRWTNNRNAYTTT